MYDANSAARRLTAILGLKPSRKSLIRAYLGDAYEAGAIENDIIGDTILTDEDGKDTTEHDVASSEEEAHQ